MESILYTVTVYTENQVGLLNQIQLFSVAAGLNIESLSVSASAIEGYTNLHYDKQRSRYDTKSRTTNRKTHLMYSEHSSIPKTKYSTKRWLFTKSQQKNYWTIAE